MLSGGGTMDQVIEEYPEMLARYPQFVATLIRHRVTARALASLRDFIPLPGWQWRLMQKLSEEPHSRKVLWRWEEGGNTGKSYFATHYSPEETFIITGGRHSDIQYAYQGERVVILDWPRDAQDRVPYGLIESLKNGYFLQTKYQAQAFRFPSPHVVVFANFEPDRTKLSADRWDIRMLDINNAIEEFVFQ
jgi:hypothetical protein